MALTGYLIPREDHSPLNAQGCYSGYQTPHGTGTDQTEWTLSLEAGSRGPLLGQMLPPWLLDHGGEGTGSYKRGARQLGWGSWDTCLPTNTYLCNPAEHSPNIYSSHTGVHPAPPTWARTELWFWLHFL